MQKEGCDGLITAARWILHRMPEAHAHRVSGIFRPGARGHPEHRGNRHDISRPTPRPKARCSPDSSIWTSAISRAVGYSTKSKRGALPKMVLLGDIVGEDESAVAAATSQVVRLANARSGEGFIAVNPEARRKFWLDRAKTAAIAKHTNAFKINEDVVIPLERLGEYTDAIERHQHRAVDSQQAGAAGRCSRNIFRRARLRTSAKTPPTRSRPAGTRRWSCWRVCGCVGSICSATWMRRKATRAACSTSCRIAASAVSWKSEVRAALATNLRRRDALHRCWLNAMPCTSASCRAACSSHCTCMPATAMCTPIFP